MLTPQTAKHTLKSFIALLLLYSISCSTTRAAVGDGCYIPEDIASCMGRLESTYQLLPHEQFADENGDGIINELDMQKFAEIYGKTAWFVDRDQDGFGDSGKVVYLSGAPSHPWLFTQQGGDANDNDQFINNFDADGDGWLPPVDCDDADPLAHPNSTSRNTARNNGSWDWNCSGAIEKDMPDYRLVAELKEEDCFKRFLSVNGTLCGENTNLYFVIGDLTWGIPPGARPVNDPGGDRCYVKEVFFVPNNHTLVDVVRCK